MHMMQQVQASGELVQNYPLKCAASLSFAQFLVSFQLTL